MNQILATSETKAKKPKKTRARGGSAPADIKKIVIIFACSILVFGLVLIGLETFRLIERTQGPGDGAPVVYIERLNDRQVSIRAYNLDDIEELVYFWTEDDKQVEHLGEDRNFLNKAIDIPTGARVLTVQIVDMQGNITTFTETFITEMVLEINLLLEDWSIQILAECNSGLEYVEYSLNDGATTIVESDPDDPYIIEIILCIDSLRLGRTEHELVVRAVSLDGNEETVSEVLIGTLRPEIAIERIGNYFYYDVYHDMGFEKIEFIFNGVIATYDRYFAGYDPDLSHFASRIELHMGENELIIRAYSLEGTMNEKWVITERTN